MSEVDEIAAQILRYLEEHPEAADTLEGVARWWLMRQQLRQSVAVVRQALERLKKEGLIVERQNLNGRTLHMLRPQR
jgi:Fe2+ or Zn2+ uptake regulation protein